MANSETLAAARDAEPDPAADDIGPSEERGKIDVRTFYPLIVNGNGSINSLNGSILDNKNMSVNGSIRLLVPYFTGPISEPLSGLDCN